MLLNPAEEAFLKYDSFCREIRCTFVGAWEPGDHWAVSAGPLSSSLGAVSSQTSPECSHDIHTGKEPSLCSQLHPEFDHLDGMQYGPSHGHWMVVCRLIGKKNEFGRANSVNWTYSFGNFSWSHVWDLRAFTIRMSCKCQKKLNMQVMKQTFGWPLREMQGYFKQDWKVSLQGNVFLVEMA